MPTPPDYPRDFSDRVFRKALSEPQNLAAFLRRALPQLAERFDCTHMEILPRTFVLDDWRDRECDILLRIPFRVSEQETKTVGVVVLLEHQTKSDHRMPLRMLHYMVEFWIRELRAWERADTDTSFRMTPVVPLVLYASSRPWGSNRTIVEMLGEPQSLHGFAPQWGPLFWELGHQTVEGLLESHAGFDRFLALVRAEDAPFAEFEALFRTVFTELYQSEGNRVYLTEMLGLYFAWATWRRPNSERPVWQTIVTQTVQEASEQERVEAMSKSALETMLEKVGNEKKNEGIEIGRNEGLAIGRQEGVELGRVDNMRQTIFRVGRQRIGEPTPAQLQQLEACSDIAILDRWFDQAITATTWADILQN